MINDLNNIYLKSQIKENEPLREYLYTKMGGKADYLVLPNRYEQVAETVKYAKHNNIPFTVLGNGSNLIIRDGGIRGIVMLLTELNQITCENNEIVAQCGATIIDVSRRSVTRIFNRA